MMTYRGMDYYFAHRLNNYIRDGLLLNYPQLSKKLVVSKNKFAIFIKRKEFNDEQWYELWSWEPGNSVVYFTEWNHGFREYLLERIKLYINQTRSAV